MKNIINPKIGILTYSYFNNYGAQLQAECLYKAINSTLNYDSEFIIPVNLQLKGQFKEPPGAWTSVSIRTQEAHELIKNSIKHGYINAEEPISKNPDSYKEGDNVISGFTVHRSRKKIHSDNQIKIRRSQS